MRLILFFFVLSQSAAISAIEVDNFKHLNLQFGNWLENYDQVQASRSGSKNGFEFAPFIAVGSDYRLNSKLQLDPEIGWVIQRTEEDIRKNYFFFRGDLTYTPLPKWHFKIGSSLILHMISADGGEEKLDNGDSEETYYIPSERKTSWVQTLDLATEYQIEDHALRFQSFIYAWSKSEQRAYSLALSFIYRLDGDSLWKR